MALKVLHPELQVSVAADRFLREVRLASRMDHPLIARVLDSGERDWIVYYVMPYVEGPTLRAALDRVRQLSVEDTVRAGCDLLDALGCAHRHGVIHRDVKPENIVVSPKGAVLVDFGIARAIEMAASEKLTRTGIAVGTSGYMSPEQISAETDIDPRADLYSVGAVLFECLAGRPPFMNRNESVVLQMHLAEPAPDVRRFRAAVPARVAEAIDRALQKAPKNRWSSAREMLSALGDATTAPRSPVAPPTRRSG